MFLSPRDNYPSHDRVEAETLSSLNCRAQACRAQHLKSVRSVDQSLTSPSAACHTEGKRGTPGCASEMKVNDSH